LLQSLRRQRPQPTLVAWGNPASGVCAAGITAPAITATSGYLFVALDQRCPADAVPASWRLCAPAVHALSAVWPTKVLVATHNRAAFDRELKDVTRPPRSGPEPAIEYAGYHGLTGLQELIQRARLVLTDLGHVQGWAREVGVPTITMQGAELRWHSPSSTTEPAVMELAGLLGLSVSREGP
jgi:hypothetical protein